MDIMIRHIFALLLFCTMGLHATVILTDDQKSYDNFTIHYFYDQSASLDIKDIEKVKFTTTLPNQFTQGYHEGAAWFKIELSNRSKNEEFVLYFSEPFWTELNLFSKRNDLWKVQKNGLNTPLEKRSIENCNPAYKLYLKSGDNATFYVRGETLSGHIGEFKIFTKEAFYKPSRLNITDIYTIYTAILFVIVLFNIYNLIIIRHRVFTYYIAYIVSFIVFIAMKSGFYLTFGIPGWSEGLHTVGTIVVMFLVMFSGRFLELYKRMPTIDKIFKISAALFLLFGLLISQNVPYSSLVFNIYSSLFFALLLFVSIKVLHDGLIGAKYYLIALMIYMPTMGLMTLTFNGLLDNTDISRYAFLVGSFIEIIFFTLILSNKYHEMNLRKIHKQKRLLKEKKSNQKFLEKLIQEKTSDLMATNQQLLNKTKELEHTKEQLTKDISERILVENQFKMQKSVLHHQAHHDPLTGLPNRLLFSQRLKESIEVAKREKRKFAIFFIDLDKFKEINDSLGHDVGDSVLKAVARILRSSIRKEDILARLAGDEFTIMIEEIGDKRDASSLAHNILKIFSEPIYIDDHALYLTCSIGISLYPQDTDNEKDLLKYADTAMYQAKENGRNNFQFYSPEMTKQALEQIEMKINIRQAIDNKEFVIYYQPQIDLSTNAIIGLEALIRWKHPTKGLITPKKFITLAEETNMIREIDQWVMHTAMDQVSQWYSEGLTPGRLALNVSVQQLENIDFITMIQENIEKCNLKPEWLELEITEGHMMKNHVEIIKTLKQIADLGVNISIDDFGTGYSSLSLLKQLPINRLKIDKSFIQDLPDDEEDIVIVNSIIALAKSLNLDVIAEGIETIEQANFLIDRDCMYVQGHYYYHPLPVEKLRAILQGKKQ
jgi:diguanylate cyclase (GGDEF)-like protein